MASGGWYGGLGERTAAGWTGGGLWGGGDEWVMFKKMTRGKRGNSRCKAGL